MINLNIITTDSEKNTISHTLENSFVGLSPSKHVKCNDQKKKKKKKKKKEKIKGYFLYKITINQIQYIPANSSQNHRCLKLVC